MAQNRRDLLENFFYNIMMNMQEDILLFQENQLYSNSDNLVINQSLYDVNPIKFVISEKEKNKLLTIKYKDVINKEQNTSCFITQDEFQEQDDVIQLPCNHCFTPYSIMQWLTDESAECPVCRYKFESVEKRVIVDSSINSFEQELVLEQEQYDDMPDLINIEQPITNFYNHYNYSTIGTIDNVNEFNSFTNILLTNIFNSFDNETNSDENDDNIIEEID